MNKITTMCMTFAALPLLTLQGCGGGANNTTQPTPENLSRFSLDPYEAAAADTNKDSIVGTWVGVYDIRQDVVGEGVRNPFRFISRKEFFVIKRSGDETFIGNCDGFNETVQVIEDTFINTTAFRIFQRSEDNELSITSESSGASGDISIATKFTARFLKVKNTTQPLGQLIWNWEDGDSGTEDIYCAGINNLENSENRISLSTNLETGSKNILQLSTISEAAANDVLFLDRLNDKSKYTSTNGEDDYVFNLNDQNNVEGFSFDFSLLEAQNQTVVGQGSVQVTLP